MHSSNHIKHKQLNRLIKDFNPTLLVHSPGRVNLIGEHTDYNNGFVMPTAIDKHIKLYLKKNNTPNTCTIHSIDYNTTITLNIHSKNNNLDEWSLFLIGVLEEIKKLGKTISGFDCMIYSELPMGAGLSSSAALECGLTSGFNALFELNLSKLDIIHLSQKAEHNYVGTQCGIMDQFASVISKQDHILQLDCQSLAYDFLPFNISPFKIVLLNTNVSHSHSSGGYNTRRQECQEGVDCLSNIYPQIKSLRDVSSYLLKKHQKLLSPLVYKRCEYVIEENQRVLAAAKSLKNNDLSTFGSLMYDSHHGLQNKFEVSCPELDWLTLFSKPYEEILGCRMMGGGFGGCTINLIHQDFIDTYIAKVSIEYEKKFNIPLTAFTTAPAQGTTLEFY